MNSGEQVAYLRFRVLGTFKSSLVRSLVHIKDHIVPHPRNHFTPHLLHHRSLALITLLVLVLKVTAVSMATLDAPLIVYSSEITPTSVIELTNQARSEAGLGSLSENVLLKSAAQNKALDMASKGYFAHVTPEGLEPWDFIKTVGYKYSSAGENLAVHFFDVEPLQEAWMNSPGHRANVLNKNYTEMGVGIARGKYENFDTMFVVEMFGTPLENITATEPKPVLVDVANDSEINVPTVAPIPLPVVAEPSPVLENQITIPAEPVLASAPKEAKPEIVNMETVIEGEDLKITATTNPVVSEVLLTYDGRGTRFRSLGENKWVAFVKRVTLKAGPIFAEASDISGGVDRKQVAEFSQNHPLQDSAGANSDKLELFGLTLDLDNTLKKLGLGLLALILTGLLVSIVRYWKIHHLKTVASASFAALFVSLMLII